MNPSARFPPLNAVRAFDVAARCTSFKQAGEELNVTPGAISRHISALEDTLGVKLFERRHRKVQLTRAGELYYAEVGPALDRIARATRSVIGADDDRLLRLKLPPTCAVRWLVPRLASFHARHPNLSVQVTTSHDPVDFERDPIDAAISWGASIGREFSGVKLVDERLVPVCCPELLGGVRLTPQQVARQTLLHSLRRPDDWGRWFAAAGVQDARLDELLKFENSSLTYQGAMDGLGLAIAQMAFIADDLRNGRLVIACDFVLETENAYYLVYPRQRARTARVRALHAWLAREASADRAPSRYCASS